MNVGGKLCCVLSQTEKYSKRNIFFTKTIANQFFFVLPYVSAYIVLSIDIIDKGTRFKSRSVRTPSSSMKWQGGT